MSLEKHRMGVVGGALLIAGALSALALPGSGSAAPPSVPKSAKQGAAPRGKPALSPMPRIPPYAKAQYDSMMSVNDRCPVRRGHLNPGIRPMYVNRQPVGFC